MAAFINLSGVTIGADPELFLKKGDQYISGHLYPCGTKDKPRQTDNGSVQCDGTALELNVLPSFTKVGFVLNFRSVLHDLDQIVRGWDKGEAYLVADSVATFGEEFLKSLPKQARELGCNPDFNAYTQSPNETPNAELPIRTGAGHLHIGWGKDMEGWEHTKKCMKLVKQLDFTVGLRTLLFDKEPRRRMLYGKAGAFRSKSYGLEYRVPSNAWCRSEELAGLMYTSCTQAIHDLNAGTVYDDLYPNFARDAIDQNDVNWRDRNPDLAHALMAADETYEAA